MKVLINRDLRIKLLQALKMGVLDGDNFPGIIIEDFTGLTRVDYELMIMESRINDFHKQPELLAETIKVYNEWLNYSEQNGGDLSALEPLAAQYLKRLNDVKSLAYTTKHPKR